jgi:hypothetical protein
VGHLASGPEDPADLRDTPLADLLFWGLHTGRFDIAGVSGSVLAGARRDLDVLIGYVDQDQIVHREVVLPALFRLRRRLDVAYELHARLVRPWWAATHDAHPPNGGFVLHELPADPVR